MSSDSLSPSGDFEEFASIAAAVAGMTGISRRVVCLADGVLVVKQSHLGTSRTITVKAGVAEDIAIVGFVSSGSSGSAPIKVYR